MRDLIMIIIGIFIGVIYLANSISFEDKCKIANGYIENGVCILNTK